MTIGGTGADSLANDCGLFPESFGNLGGTSVFEATAGNAADMLVVVVIKPIDGALTETEETGVLFGRSVGTLVSVGGCVGTGGVAVGVDVRVGSGVAVGAAVGRFVGLVDFVGGLSGIGVLVGGLLTKGVLLACGCARTTIGAGVLTRIVNPDIKPMVNIMTCTRMLTSYCDEIDIFNEGSRSEPERNTYFTTQWRLTLLTYRRR